ncbi:MAG: D-alanyl-D-alanine carboxypeptidase family protein [Candidatus Roizmanbacteria bacterium]
MPSGKKKDQTQPPRKKEKTAVSLVMTIKFLVPVILFSLLFLLYPGNTYYLDLFAYNPLLSTKASRITGSLPSEIPLVPNYPTSIPSTATSIYITDLETATPLFKKSEHLQLFPASTTKVITALTAIDTFKPDDILTVRRVINEGQTAGLVLGEKMTFDNLLYALLVNSANDSAFAIADNYSGGYNVFITAMNKKAEELGMKDTAFKNPAGLDEQGHFSTAFDLSVAARALAKNKELVKIVGIKEITVSDVDFKYFHRLYTINELLGVIPGIAGLKTGYTELAGQNFISLYKYQGHSYIIVVLKSQDRFLDTRAAVAWIQGNIRYKRIDNH